jgi:hypothetical protein
MMVRIFNNHPKPQQRSEKMAVRSIIRSSLLTISAGFFVTLLCLSQASANDDSKATTKEATETTATEKKADEKKAAEPSHQVYACYFHRTNRCPTCKKIGSYIEESVNTEFAPQIKDKSVRVMQIDFQDAKNEKFTKAYKISGPTLVIMNVSDGKVTTWKVAPKVWSLVSKKDDFSKYVKDEVQSYLKEEKSASRENADDTKAQNRRRYPVLLHVLIV